LSSNSSHNFFNELWFNFLFHQLFKDNLTSLFTECWDIIEEVDIERTFWLDRSDDGVEGTLKGSGHDCPDISWNSFNLINSSNDFFSRGIVAYH